MAIITLTNQTNSPFHIGTTLFSVGVPVTADLEGTDLQIAEVYRDAGLAVMEDVAAPENLTLPEITGDPIVGETLSGSDGTWTGGPTFAYQWERDGVPIEDATDSEYILVEGDIGAEITFTVTATNAAGSDAATSDPVGPVTDDND